MTGFDFAAAAGIPKNADGSTNFAAAAGIGSSQVRGSTAGPGDADQAILKRAQAKLKAGQPLTKQEAEAMARAQAAIKTADQVGIALQPLQALSDITKGLIGQVRGTGQATVKGMVAGDQGQGGALARGLKAAAGHVTYGAAEYLPGMAGARARGVSGMDLLKGTKYEGNVMAALAVEVFADPSTLLTGAGAVLKVGSTAGRLTQLEKFAQTAEGAATIRGALLAANQKGDALLKAGDEITGVPAAVRAAAGSKVGQAVKAAAAKVANQQLPEIKVLGKDMTAALNREGSGTIGDAFLTPDQKAMIYTPEQLATDAFRTDARLGVDDLGKGIRDAAQADAQLAMRLTQGLNKTDAAEVNRLLGVFTTTSKPEVAAEALRKLTAISQRVGKPLEPAFVAAVKASDRVSQVTLGQNLKAQGLPVVLNPEVTKAIQEAQTGEDLLKQVGKYTTSDGRPRGILMTQYTGRSDPLSVVQKLMDGPEIPAIARVDAPQVARSLDAAAADVVVPPKPVEPLGATPRGAPPVNPATTADNVQAAVQGATYTPQQVLDNLFSGKSAAPVGRVSDVTPPPAALNEARAADFIPPAQTAAATALPDAPAPTVTPPEVGTAKTPQQVIEDILTPRADPVTTPSPAITRTAQEDARPIALPEVPAERTVTKSVPTTYRTVEVDANALDWAALPDTAARRSVLNAIGASNARVTQNAAGRMVLDRPNITVPLDHPTISRYFSNEDILGAQRQGTTVGTKTVVQKQDVPDWFNPRDPAPLDVQRAAHDQAVRDAQDNAFPNDAGHIQNLHDQHGDYAWVLGGEYASFDRLTKPPMTRLSGNEYAARVAALRGTPPTKGEVFQYRLQLARYQQAQRLRNLNTQDVAAHLKDFYTMNPEATLYEGILNAAQQFGVGRPGVKHLQGVLRQAESGFERQLSSLERKEFAQYLAAEDAVKRGAPGGTLVSRLKRNPQAVSEEFQQVFQQDINALRLLDEQVRTRTAAIVRAEKFRQYRDYLTQTGQLVTYKQLRELQLTPAHRLTPDQLELRTYAANAISKPGAQAGWKVMDREVEGFFQKGDMVPWWAYFDLFHAGSVQDAAVTGAVLDRGGLDTYNRLWSTMNAQLLGSPSSLINDQIGQFLQMALWGVTPDALIEGMIRRATATPEAMKLMRDSGIHSAKLESNLGSNTEALTRLAARLDGDTDLTRMERVIDGILRFRERGTGLNPQAMTGAAGAAADVAHMGLGYVFQLRSLLADLQRESLYFHRIALGDTPTAAAQFANNVLMDMRLVPGYARIVRKAWPFFNWIAMSGPRSVITVLRKPGINAAYNRVAAATDNPDDPHDSTRRILARDGGYVNLGVDERNGTRLYLDPRNWNPTNTIPQLMDWSGTKVGAVSLPWYANLLVTLQWGQDRFGRNIYDSVLDGGSGGFTEAYKKDQSKTLRIAAQTLLQQFQPSYAPGSPRAQAFVRSVLATAQLPEDGSKDIAVAKMLAGTPQGRAYLVYLQNGTLAAIDRDLLGVRSSEYSLPAASMLRSVTNFFLPMRGVNASQNTQGDAQQKLAVGQLEFQSWIAQQKKLLAQMEAGGASPEQLRAKEEQISHEAERRGARLDYLDMITR